MPYRTPVYDPQEQEKSLERPTVDDQLIAKLNLELQYLQDTINALRIQLADAQSLADAA